MKTLTRNIIFIIMFIIIFLSPKPLLAKTLSNYDQGVNLYNEGKYELAMVYFERAFKESPMKNSLYFYLGNIYNHKKMFSKSIEAYKRGLDTVSSKETRLIYLYNLAQSYQGAKQYKEALKIYRVLETKDNKYPNIYLYMGMIYFNLKNKDETIKAWETYLVKAPNNPQYESVRKAINILKGKNFTFPPSERDKYKIYGGSGTGGQSGNAGSGYGVNNQTNNDKNTKDIDLPNNNVKVNSEDLKVENREKKEGEEYDEIEK